MGQRFAQFEIIRPLGLGGMAETAEAVRRGMDGFEQRVCLKRILPAFNRDADFVRAFRNEAKLAVRLVHPHICRIYDFGDDDGRWWMSMELVEAGDLRELIRHVDRIGQPLPIDLVLLLAIDLASALHHAHSLRIDGKPADIVHRDISPSNVLIDSAGHFKLADFGIAKAQSSSGEGGTRTGIIKGKVPYMAPEHSRGEKLDGRADLWSFGVVLYEALAGKRPFRGAHDVEIFLHTSNGTYEPIERAAPHTPPVLRDVVAGLLQPDLGKRIARAADVLERLAATPPPANARLRLAELCERIDAERKRPEARALGEATTAAGDGHTATSVADSTQMVQGGVSLEPARQPESAPADAPTRTVAASLPAMETRELEAKLSTDPSANVPSGVREAMAIEQAIRDSQGAEAAMGVVPTRISAQLSAVSGASPSSRAEVSATPFIVEGPSATATIPTAPRSSVLAILAASAAVGLVGLGLAAWGVGVFDARPEAIVAATPAASPSAAVAPSTAPPHVVAAPPPIAPPPPVPVVPTPVVPEVVPTAIAPELAVAPEPSPPEPVAATPPPAEPTPTAAPAERADEAASPEAAARGTIVIGVVGFGDIWVDGRRVAEGTDHLERRVRPGRHRVGAGIGEPHETVSVDVVAGESVEVLLHAR